MLVTDVRVKLAREPGRVKAYCTATFDDCFVVHDIKVVEGASGLIISMPSRKATDHCPQCQHKNLISDSYCAECGYRLGEYQPVSQENLFFDIAHPISRPFRHYLEGVVLEKYNQCVREDSLYGSAMSGVSADCCDRRA